MPSGLSDTDGIDDLVKIVTCVKLHSTIFLDATMQ